MVYQYKCLRHGLFEVRQGMHDEHKANCPVCNTEAQRVYSPIGFYWDNPKPLYHKDGSYEEKY